MADAWQLATILIGGIATIAIFSFIIKENIFFRLFEHIYIGIAAGLGVMFAFKNTLWPQVLVPLFGLDIVQYPDGTYSAQYSYFRLLFLVPMLFGLLYYFIYSRRYNWLAKIVIGFSLGAAGGAAFEGFSNQILPQVISSVKPLVVLEQTNSEAPLAIDLFESLSNIVFVFTLLAVMYYFFFSFKPGGKIMQKAASAGRWLMMLSFGAYFGSTVMARMALLVERLQFLISDWFGAIRILVGFA